MPWLDAAIAAAAAAGNRPTHLRHSRDKTMLLLDFWRGFRRDELTRLRGEHHDAWPRRQAGSLTPSQQWNRVCAYDRGSVLRVLLTIAEIMIRIKLLSRTNLSGDYAHSLLISLLRGLAALEVAAAHQRALLYPGYATVAHPGAAFQALFHWFRTSGRGRIRSTQRLAGRR